ncbi:unnamed protein product [Linum tenue]|uniref:Uncharacterized protein n=1 Tax=Linum tenue TaxID=586396 RepID=A0AAV0RSQ9_9ROSI|nr:unnamed protein product [Linum tenue]
MPRRIDTRIRLPGPFSSETPPNPLRLPHLLHAGNHPRRLRRLRKGAPRLGAGAAVQRALPLHLASGLLGEALEPDGHTDPPPLRLRPDPGFVHTVRGAQVGSAASCVRHVRGIRVDARAHVLLHGPSEAHVGDHLLLLAPRGGRDGGDCGEEGRQGQGQGREVVLLSADHGIRHYDCVLALLPQVRAVSVGCQGV